MGLYASLGGELKDQVISQKDAEVKFRQCMKEKIKRQMRNLEPTMPEAEL